MNLIEARRFVRAHPGTTSLPFLMATSWDTGTLPIFVQAEAARRDRQAQTRTLEFGTLAQTLLTPPVDGEVEVFLLLPWDLVPEADWRSGILARSPDTQSLLKRAAAKMALVSSRPLARPLYLPAPMPPMQADPRAMAALEAGLVTIATQAGASLLPPHAFSMSSYLGMGCAIGATAQWEAAATVVDAALGAVTTTPRKVLATDCDGVLWAGVVAEDGASALRFHPEGKGFRHFLYQSSLRRLKEDGVLLAAVSRNRPEDVAEALAQPGMVLKADDFVEMAVSYDAKSARLRAMAARLNLGLDSLVFVDDNPVEIAEVSQALPQVTCLAFPTTEDEFPAFLHRLARLFSRAEVTEEDRRRTELYRLREAVPVTAAAGDLTAFLAGMGMRLEIRDAGAGDWTRPFQLINKTNQFNLNGRRFDEAEIAEILASGGTLYAGRLTDRSGDHGEILACLVGADGIIEALVLSCRVFQRRVEHAFLAWLAGRQRAPGALRFAATPRNEPLRTFIQAPPFQHDGSDGLVRFDHSAIRAAFEDSLKLVDTAAS
ncbi:HAD-IIIC family phosphatase [Magnetospirillum aberrantis]|uniref:HAD-IIIC family phosphatase n=1 Tax=Magnetospirillum aberrantis SpK TaxID=908842 RepID=A0A7C9QSP3_9PROT|nr:HAD-IIIC family phosphatase [Magnetospirillum aberrantis]NFV78556.1 HAD-IIIC family phosphatase [Magnetospirillum aberrantis SpK]